MPASLGLVRWRRQRLRSLRPRRRVPERLLPRVVLHGRALVHRPDRPLLVRRPAEDPGLLRGRERLPRRPEWSPDGLLRRESPGRRVLRRREPSGIVGKLGAPLVLALSACRPNEPNALRRARRARARAFARPRAHARARVPPAQRLLLLRGRRAARLHERRALALLGAPRRAGTALGRARIRRHPRRGRSPFPLAPPTLRRGRRRFTRPSRDRARGDRCPVFALRSGSSRVLRARCACVARAHTAVSELPKSERCPRGLCAGRRDVDRVRAVRSSLLGRFRLEGRPAVCPRKDA